MCSCFVTLSFQCIVHSISEHTGSVLSVIVNCTFCCVGCGMGVCFHQLLFYLISNWISMLNGDNKMYIVHAVIAFPHNTTTFVRLASRTLLVLEIKIISKVWIDPEVSPFNFLLPQSSWFLKKIVIARLENYHSTNWMGENVCFLWCLPDSLQHIFCFCNMCVNAVCISPTTGTCLFLPKPVCIGFAEVRMDLVPVCVCMSVFLLQVISQKGFCPIFTVMWITGLPWSRPSSNSKRLWFDWSNLKLNSRFFPFQDRLFHGEFHKVDSVNSRCGGGTERPSVLL